MKKWGKWGRKIVKSKGEERRKKREATNQIKKCLKRKEIYHASLAEYLEWRAISIYVSWTK